MVGGGMLKKGVAFAANLALVRLLAPESFGEFAIVQANVSLVGAFFNFRTSSLLLQAPAEELRPRALSRYTGALIAETVLVGGGALAALGIFGVLNGKALLFLLASLAGSWVGAQRSIYERTFEYKKLSILETSAGATSNALAVAAALLGAGSVVLYARSAVSQAIVAVGIRRLGGWRRLPMRWLTLEDWTHVLRRFKGFWADGMLVRLFDRATVLLVGAIAGNRMTGFFFQARKFAFIPDQVLGPLTNRVALNHFKDYTTPNKRYANLRKILLFLSVFLIPAAGLTLLLTDPVIPWILGAEWNPVVPILKAMTGVIVGMPLLSLMQAYFMSMNRMRLFILIGRGGQFLALALFATVAYYLKTDTGIWLGGGFSAAFLIGLIISLAIATCEQR